MFGVFLLHTDGTLTPLQSQNALLTRTRAPLVRCTLTTPNQHYPSGVQMGLRKE